MLDIKYFKQIDEVLEVKGYKYSIVNNMPSLIFPDKEFEHIDTIGTELANYGYHDRYELYLVRVIEAINKKFYNDDDFFFRVDQDYESLTVIEGCIGVEDFNTFNGKIDEAKEKAIQFIMDHIKEKV